VRYWAAGAKLGTDTAYDEKVFAVGKRLVTKIFNAAKFVLAQSAEIHPIAHELDRAFVAGLRALVADATADFDEFDYAAALARTEQFFWSQLTDSYLELVKARARGDHGTPAERGSAVHALRLALSVLLRLFAPALPYVTEHVWRWTEQTSIHRGPWPTAEELAVPAPADAQSFAVAAAAQAAINKAKTQAGASVGRVVTELSLAANERTHATLARVLADVTSAVRAQACERVVKPELVDGVIEVAHLVVAPKPAAEG
jgi:valyl-tRNA synthetase